MDLKEFISETLSQIVSGVKGAQESAKRHGAEINPELFGNVQELAKEGIVQTNSGGSTTIVEFDVALTVTEGTGTKGGIGVFTGMVNLGSSGQSKSENISVSRVQFKVPLALPK